MSAGMKNKICTVYNWVVVTRSFQPSWFDRWTWLHCNEENNSGCCFICMRAKSENKLHWSLNSDKQYLEYSLKVTYSC